MQNRQHWKKGKVEVGKVLRNLLSYRFFKSVIYCVYVWYKHIKKKKKRRKKSLWARAAFVVYVHWKFHWVFIYYLFTNCCIFSWSSIMIPADFKKSYWDKIVGLEIRKSLKIFHALKKRKSKLNICIIRSFLNPSSSE